MLQNTTIHPNKALWEKGDFTRIAASVRESERDIVEALGIRPGLRVLDLGCGDGTTALPAAIRGAEVLGVDIAANLVAAGRRRAEAAGLTNLRFQEGDAARLHDLPDAQFDLVMTIFGAMFAAQPDEVAREMVRVTKPGGRIVMANWIPGDPTLVAQILRLCSAHLPPPPPGAVSPMAWGEEAQVLNRFAAAGIPASRVTFQRETLWFRLQVSPARFVELFRNYYGPVMNAFAAAEKAGKAGRLQEELERLFTVQNRSGRDDAVSIPANYLRVTVQV
ncbi:MAG TPA: methyltransferase domain-containing protein [Lacunisphaera sp.]|jgi:SAM-dependent methyltransferase|nr:methyltransferase domain-containing protein [Lacunisphaera sp.]